MNAPTRQVSLSLETAISALIVLERALAEKLNVDDFGNASVIIERAKLNIERAISILIDVRQDAETALDRI